MFSVAYPVMFSMNASVNFKDLKVTPSPFKGLRSALISLSNSLIVPVGTLEE